MQIERYVLVGLDDEPEDALYESLDEAKREARRRGDVAVVAYVFEYSDSELVWTPGNSDIWPPDAEAHEHDHDTRRG